ncbi:hypothetical protein IWW39_005475 [Coemansia spiralis]|uniref:C3H1-type domain-containing protein n=1 Tax=Coemansia spiralis TaxID=417178 RepID=A0A9W8GFC5_9FUNG|nr:hypothetical protein IWW39_005475 [Coemansia spiralis]
MSSSKVDCHFFLTSSCRNGDQCPFRHSERAKGTEEVCLDYAQSGQCPVSDCGKRHTEVSNRSTKPPSEVPCRNEENGAACTRPGCIFKHERPTKPSGLNAAAKAFVPQGRPVRPVRPVKEWTPASKGSMEWTPASKVSMEWTPASKAGRPPVRPHANMEWTPNKAARPPPLPGTAGVQAAGQRVAMARPQRPVASLALSGDSQEMDVDVPQPPMQAAVRRAERPAAPASVAGVASIPTIYDILGITEQAPASTDRFARDRRGKDRARSSTVSHVPAVSFAPMPTTLVSTQASGGFVWPQTQVPSVSDSGLPVSSVVAAPPMATPVVSNVANTASTLDVKPTPTLDVKPTPVASVSEEAVAALSDDNPLRAMVSLDDLEAGEDEEEGKAESPPMAAQTTISSPPVPPSVPVVVAPVARAAASHKTPAKPRSVPPPRDTKTSSPMLGAADPAGAESSVPKILSFQEIMERKRRKLAEASASNVASPPPAVEAAAEVKAVVEASAAVEVKAVVAASPALVGKRRIIIDEDDAESDASEGKRARPESPARRKELAIPDYVAMFERELADITVDLDGPLENTPAGDVVSRATLANTFVDQDIDQLLKL